MSQHERDKAANAESRGSFIVRKLVSLLMRTFQADWIDEEKIDADEVSLYYRPVFVVDYVGKANVSHITPASSKPNAARRPK